MEERMKVLAKRLVFSLGILAVLAAVFAGCENPWMKSITAPLYKDKETPEEPALPEETTVTGVTVSPAVVNVVKGGTQSFTAAVNGTGSPAQTVTWSVEGAANTGTVISTTGVLTVSAAETAGTLTVLAASTANPAVSGTVTVTVTSVLTSIADIADYLANASGSPIPLPVAMNLSDGGWADLLLAIQNAGAGKYVNLDLSACGISGTEFDPYMSTATGESKIVSLVLPDDAMSIKAGDIYIGPSFQHFSSLKSVIGDNIAVVGDYAFRDCTSLTTVNLPVATNIGYGTFFGCTTLVTVNLPKVTSIDTAAFLQCTALTTLDLPEVTSIGNNAISGCTLLKTVNLPKAVIIGGGALSGNPALETIDLPMATTFGPNAFSGSGLKTVDLPAAITIEIYAFQNCTVLTAVSLPASLTSITGNPFMGCTNLTNITIAAANPYYSHNTDHRMLLNKTGTTLIAYPTAAGTITVTGITSVGDRAFQYCDALESVDLPAAVSVGEGAFYSCDVLTTVDLPMVTSIGESAFNYCRALGSLNLPASPPGLGGTHVFQYTDLSGTLAIYVPTGAVPVYEGVWGVSASTSANGNPSVYGGNHKAIEITDNP
jgi:hypothetical protein